MTILPEGPLSKRRKPVAEKPPNRGWHPVCRSVRNPHVPDLYALVHREAGPVKTYLNIYDAMKAMQEVLRDEPDWWQDVWAEPFHFVVEEPSAA